ncbi:hypothetical protein ACOMHN_041156 [Nucella lapillus]
MATKEQLAEFQKTAEDWLHTNVCGFQLRSVDEEESRLVFDNPDVRLSSFFVTCPCDGESWGVWSDEESVIGRLHGVMEYLDGRPHLTMDLVLDRITRSLSQVKSSVSSSSAEKPADCGDDDDDEEEDEEDDFEFDYYGEGDRDVTEDETESKESNMRKGGAGLVQLTKSAESSLEMSPKMVDTFFKASGGKTTPPTIHRLVKDMRSLAKVGEKYGFSAAPRGENLFNWAVEIMDIPKDSQLGKDLNQYAKKTRGEAVIQMEMQFPWNYPFSPPFIRVTRPRFKFRTGHVTVGGSLCMQMLTKSGWMPTNDIEGVLVQVRAEILSDPKASLDLTNITPYTEDEAKEAFERMVLRYGWI